MGSRVGSARALLLGFAIAFVASYGDTARAQDEGDSWWSRNFEVHGFFQSRAYWRSPNLKFGREFQISSWRNELEMNTSLRLYEKDDSSLVLYGVLRPIYEGVYDLNPDLWGHRAHGGALGSNTGTGTQAKRGDPLSGGAGARLAHEFTLVNCDTQFLFTGEMSPCGTADDVIFYGALPAIWAPQGRDQPLLGGWAGADTFAFAALTSPSLAASLASIPVGQSTAAPFRAINGRFSRGSLDQAPSDINAREWELQYDCLDNAHPWCFARELYFEFKQGDTTVRLGKQQVVWGKTDAFRMQDIVNPIDISYHNVYPDLEERRIPQLILDVIHSFGRVGPLEDVSLELVWNFDRFLPVQVGQCGEPYAFVGACEARADAGGHGLLNLSLAGVKEIDWQLENTEPGLRLEFRTPNPSIAWSLSGYWGFQDAPSATYYNHYSTANPNPAAMLFLQKALTGSPLDGIVPTFDPYDPASTAAASAALLGGYNATVGALCGGLVGQALANCITANGIQALTLPYTGAEAYLFYKRVLTLGASADYQIPGIDTVLRVEASYDFDRALLDSTQLDSNTYSDVVSAAIGLDRSIFIPFLNRDRTAFASFQQFVEHITDYNDNGHDSGMVNYEWNLITTAFLQNYWRNDSIVLTNFAAFDWGAKAWITGPKLQYIHNDKLSFEMGVNMIWGSTQKHNIRDLCADSTLSCLGDPTTWQPGQWQAISAAFARTAESPYWSKESYADNWMENRDEVWIGVKYQY